MARLIATSRMSGTNNENMQENPAELGDIHLMLILDEMKDVLRDLIAGMGTLDNHISLY